MRVRVCVVLLLQSYTIYILTFGCVPSYFAAAGTPALHAAALARLRLRYPRRDVRALVPAYREHSRRVCAAITAL